MPNGISLADIICNIFNEDYSLYDSASDLGKIKTEIRRLEMYEGNNSEKVWELKRLESIQEKLTLFKLHYDDPNG